MYSCSQIQFLTNITMGDESITLAQVIEASKKVGAHDFISKLPGEYDYNVREREAFYQ